jgi:uncharacterized protein YndB with AHSA1/START domain
MSVTHSTFSLERTYDASPARVFAAFAEPEQKAAWFGGPPEWPQAAFEVDFRVGGREINRGGPQEGPMHSFEALYYDIVPDERIVYSYEMHLDDKRISVSLATIELSPAADGTRLVLTEQGAYLDDFDDPKLRETGTQGLLEALGAYLDQTPAERGGLRHASR